MSAVPQAETTDYFKVLVSVFSGQLQARTQQSLPCFHCSRLPRSTFLLPASPSVHTFAHFRRPAPCVLQAAGNEHMREFWAIVPALSLSYVDAMVAAKDKLGKRGKDGLGAQFTDEGFALGVAYLLRVLGSDKSFDNVHWHASLIRHFSQERKAVQAEAAKLGAGAR